MELAVSKFGEAVRMLSEEELEAIISDIEKEKEEAKKSNQEAVAMET